MCLFYVKPLSQAYACQLPKKGAEKAKLFYRPFQGRYHEVTEGFCQKKQQPQSYIKTRPRHQP